VKDLTVQELQALVSSTVKEAMEESFEDLLAMSSESFCQSIREARADYAAGRVEKFEDVFDV